MIAFFAASSRFVVPCFVLALLMAAPSYGAQRTWDGGGKDWDWRNSANWDGTLRLDPIEQGDTLVFPEGPTKLINTNDFGANTNFNALIYSGDDYQTYGNRIGLSNGVSVTHASGATALHLPILLRRDQTFSVSSANAFLHLFSEVNMGLFDLTFDGAGGTILIGEIVNSRFGGRGSVRKTGSGRLTILQQTDHDAPTIVSGGTLAVEHRMTNSIVTVQAGGTLRGSSRIGGLNAVGGLVFPGGTTPDALECRGDATLAAGSTLRIRLNGTTAGITYDQLDVVGSVTLGGTLELVFGFTPAVGDRFTIIENDGIDDVSGTFAGMPEGHVFTANGRPFRISYGDRLGIFGRGNDVTIEALPALAIWDGGGNLNKFWSQPLNWVGDVLPQPGDDVQFATGAGTLVTVNDFPAGREFGSIIFAGGNHRLEGGNAAQIAGNIRLTQTGNVEILAPLNLAGGVHLTQGGDLTLSGPVTLTANQTFFVDHPDSNLRVEGALGLADHNLTIRNEPGGNFSYNGVSISVRLHSSISGSGTLIKEGLGGLYTEGTSTHPLTTVNAGTLHFESSFEGKVVVNPGANLHGGFAQVSGLADVDVQGGTFRPSFGASVDGTLRMTDGATFAHAIIDQGANGVHYTYAYVSGAVELTNCNLTVDLHPSTPISPGSKFTVIYTGFGNTVSGTFNGLPEGARFFAGGHSFIISYADGVYLIADPPFIWDGGASGNNLWTAAANWVADLAPNAGASLAFPGGVSKLGTINDFPAGTSFQRLDFTGPSYLIVGNAFRVTASISNQFASGDTTISADLAAVGSAFACDLAGSSRLLLEGSVTGTATWKKTGTGTLRLSGSTPNTLGRIEVWGGELQLDKDAGVTAISQNLQIGDGTNDIRVTLLNDDQITDSADVTIRERARFDLNGQNETIDQLFGDGTIAMQGRFPGRSSRLTVNNGSFSGVITGDGGLTKMGSFTLTLSGENTYSGSTIVDGGTLSVPGALASSAIRVNEGSILLAEGLMSSSAIRLNGGSVRGRGTVGSVTADLGGTLQPGSGGADFQVALRTRDIALNSATTLRALLTSIDPGYENHKLQVTGAVNLGGSVLSVDLSGNFRPAVGRSFVIVENDGSDAINGTFGGLPEGAIFGGDGLPFTISYTGGTGNDVVITRVPGEPASLGAGTVLGNGQVRFEGVGTPGVVYSIQAASNLNPVIQWAPLFNRTGNASGIFEIVETNSLQRPMRFYRAILP